MTPIAHAAVGLIAWKYFAGRENLKALLIYIFVACAVDLDFLLFYIFGKPEIFVHQLYSHTVFVSLAAAAIFFPWMKTAKERWGLTLAALSHLILDLFLIDLGPPTGFRLFYPVYNKFFSYGFFPYMIRGSLAEIFSIRNLVAMGCEVLVFVVPAVILCRKELVLIGRKLTGRSKA